MSVEVVEDAGMRLDLGVPTEPVGPGGIITVRGRLTGADPAIVGTARVGVLRPPAPS